MNNYHFYCECQECRDKRHIEQLKRELVEMHDKMDENRLETRGVLVNTLTENTALRTALTEITHAADDRLTRPPRGVGDSLEQRRRLETAVASAKLLISGRAPSTDEN